MSKHWAVYLFIWYFWKYVSRSGHGQHDCASSWFCSSASHQLNLPTCSA